MLRAVAMSSDFQQLITEAREKNQRRLHPRRILATKLAAYLPAAMRFKVCGLPGGLAPANAWKKKEVALPAEAGGGTAFLASIENGIACDFGAHLTADGLIIPELSPGANGPIMERFLIHQRMLPEVEHRAGSVISLALDGHKNFYHWMYEVLPRWHIIKASGLTHNGSVYAFLQHRFHRESLALLGLVPARIVDSASLPFLRADVVQVPSFVRSDEPWICQWLRDALLAPALKHSSLHTRKRIYISRKQAKSRKIVNEPALVELLKKYDFTEICLEDYALSGQIALFHAAQAIVAPHGAGLTNLTFSESGAFALELIAQGLEGPFYERIAKSRHLRYQQIRCALQNPADLYGSDIHVDLEAVKTALAQL